MYINSNKKLFYTSRIKFIKIFIYVYLILNIAQINFIFEEKMVVDLFNIIKVLILLMVFTFLNNIIKNSKRKIYKVIKVFLFISIVFLIISISGYNHFTRIKSLKNLFEYNSFIKIEDYYQLVSFYILSKYRYKEDESFINFEAIILTIIINLMIFQISYNNIFFSKISLVFNIILLLITGINIYKKRIKTKCIDLLKINFILFVIFLTMSLIKKYLNLDLNISGLIFIKEAVLLTSFILIIKTYLDRNYNFIFEETKESQSVLDDINVRIKINNHKLEESLKKLKERQNMQKGFLNYFPNPVIMINENYRIVYSNKEFINIIGEENIKNIINRKLTDLIKLDFNFNDIKDNEFSNRYVTNLQNNKMEVRIINLNNKYDKGKYILLFNDLSEERKIIQMKEKLENKKMRENLKNNFLSSIYHDLKTPVNIIYSATQLEKILIGNNDIEKLENYNNISKKNCITLTQLTNNLIDMSKIDYENINATMELGNIVEFIEDYLANLTDYIKNNNINLLFDTEEEEIFIYFDKEMMMRIILNLISNSLKFTEENGEIKILIKSKEEKVIIEFSDTGIGMSEEFMERAFEKYEIGSRETSKGSGIGLFVVYNLVKAQRGDIEIKSKLNKGTTFVINLNK